MERSLPIQRAQRHAFSTLIKGVGNIKPINENNITIPGIIQQEISYINTVSVYRFRFGSDAIAATAALNNFLLGDNDVIQVYGIQVLFGYSSGTDKTNRVYRAYGVTPSDDALYNGEMSMEFESTSPVAFMQMSQFRDENTWDGNNGLVLINPHRLVTGRMSKFNVIIDLDDISGLTITTGAYIITKLHGAIGRA